MPEKGFNEQAWFNPEGEQLSEQKLAEIEEFDELDKRAKQGKPAKIMETLVEPPKENKTPELKIVENPVDNKELNKKVAEDEVAEQWLNDGDEQKYDQAA